MDEDLEHTDPFGFNVYGRCRNDRQPCPICFEPFLPYKGTQGHSGTDTSKTRAKNDVKSGKAKQRQWRTLSWLYDQGEVGGTWKELSDVTGLHHGVTSGVLSVLHLGERIVMLAEVRDKCHPYVHPRFVAGRDTRARKQSSVEIIARLSEENAALRRRIAELEEGS